MNKKERLDIFIYKPKIKNINIGDFRDFEKKMLSLNENEFNNAYEVIYFIEHFSKFSEDNTFLKFEKSEKGINIHIIKKYVIGEPDNFKINLSKEYTSNRVLDMLAFSDECRKKGIILAMKW